MRENRLDPRVHPRSHDIRKAMPHHEAEAYATLDHARSPALGPPLDSIEHDILAAVQREVGQVDTKSSPRSGSVESSETQVSADSNGNISQPPPPFSSGHDLEAAKEGARADGQAQLARTKTGSSSSKPYSAFSNRMKWLIVSLGGIAGVFSPIRRVLPTSYDHSPGHC